MQGSSPCKTIHWRDPPRWSKVLLGEQLDYTSFVMRIVSYDICITRCQPGLNNIYWICLPVRVENIYAFLDTNRKFKIVRWPSMNVSN